MIAFYAVKQWFHYLYTGKFTVRNSPIDHIAGILRSSVVASKSIDKITFGTGMSYALALELDDILEKEGYQAYFLPKLKGAINASLWGIEDSLKTVLIKFGITDLNKINVVEMAESSHTKIRNMNETEKIEFEKESKITYEEAIKVLDYIEKKITQVSLLKE
jgi:hypothetical protein